MMHWYQLLAIIFSLLMLYLTFLDYKKRNIRALEWIFFSTLWLMGIVLGLVPESSQFALQTFRVVRLLDLVSILGILLLLVLVYYIYVKTRKTEKRLEDLTRKDALKDLKAKRG